MAGGAMLVSGTDVYTAARFVVGDVRGLDAWPERSLALADVYGSDGRALANPRRRSAERTITVEGAVDGRDGGLVAKLDALADLLERPGPLALAFPLRRPGVAWAAYLDGQREIVIPRPTFGGQSWARLSLTFVCPDPYGVATSASGTGGTFQAAGTPRACDVGTGPSDLGITIRGAATSPITLIHKTHTGTEIGRMVIAVALADNTETVRIDTARAMVWKDLGAGEVSAMADLDAGYWFPVLRPEYGDRAGAAYQTIEVDKGEMAFAFYRRWR